MDGVLNSKQLGAGGVWVEATYNAYPDWVQVNFAGSRTISRIDVITTPDDILNAEPTPSMTFTKYGITAYDVQAWNGSAWVAVGSITGNNLVWRTFTFPSVTADRIRILVNAAAPYGYSFVAEVQAWGS